MTVRSPAPGPNPAERPFRDAAQIPFWTAFVVFAFALGLGYAASGLALYAAAWLEAGGRGPISPDALHRAGLTLPGLLSVVGAIAVAELLVVLTAVRSLQVPARAALRLHPSRAGAGALALAALGMLCLSHALDSSIHLAGLGEDGTLGMLRDIFGGASPAGLIASMAVVALLAGVAEELLFRGFMQARFTARWGPLAGVVVTSFFFGLVHLDAVQGSAAAMLGLYLGALTEWSGSIRPAILCHVLNNAFGTLGPELLGGNESLTFHYASLAVAVIGLMLILPWLRRHLDPASAERSRESELAG